LSRRMALSIGSPFLSFTSVIIQIQLIAPSCAKFCGKQS
jgi:hypothetical protein